jgi:hypothetical protein
LINYYNLEPDKPEELAYKFWNFFTFYYDFTFNYFISSFTLILLDLIVFKNFWF